MGVYTWDSDSARARILRASGLFVPAAEFSELLTLPLGGGDCIPFGRTAPLSAAGFTDGSEPSEVCKLLFAGGRPVAAWFFFDLKRKAMMVYVQQPAVDYR